MNSLFNVIAEENDLSDDDSDYLEDSYLEPAISMPKTNLDHLKSILIADDQLINLEVLRQNLKKLNLVSQAKFCTNG